MNKRYYENSMSNNQQQLDPWSYIIFLKYETSLEEYLLKLQNLTVYNNNTNLEFLFIMANVRMPYVCYITLNNLDRIVKK